MDLLQTSPNGKQGLAARRPGELEQDLRRASVELEVAFLTEMLKSAGIVKSGTDLGGKERESEFGTFLVRAYATEVAQAGGIGLSELLFQSLMEKTNEQRK